MNQNSEKPLPSVELSLKFMSWSVKEFVAEFKIMQQMLDQKLSQIDNQLREMNKQISKKEEAPF